MADVSGQRLLEALLDSWNRNNTILLNVLRALPEGGLDARAMAFRAHCGELDRELLGHARRFSCMSSRVRIVAITFSLMAAASSLRADWTGVGSTGTIDEGDLGKVVLNNDGSASIRSTISSTSAKIRFNVTSNPGIDFFHAEPGQESANILFTMRVRDNGRGARVIATLKRITLGGGSDASMPQATVTAATIDSDLSQLPPSNDWNTVWAQHYNRSAFAATIQQGDSMDFLRFGWVVEVQLIKHDSTGNPGIMGVQLFRDQP